MSSLAGRPLNGLDFGFAVDPDAFIRVYCDAKRRRLFVAEEFFGVRTPADRLAAEVAARAGTEHGALRQRRPAHDYRSCARAA